MLDHQAGMYCPDFSFLFTRAFSPYHNTVLKLYTNSHYRSCTFYEAKLHPCLSIRYPLFHFHSKTTNQFKQFSCACMMKKSRILNRNSLERADTPLFSNLINIFLVQGHVLV